MSKKPLIRAALGARGTGKSAWCVQVLAQEAPARLAIWDLMQEHGDPTGDLGECVRAMAARRFRVVFHPSRDDATRARQFEIWCRALLASKGSTAWVEELAFVTQAHKAPAAWREMVLLGRHERHSLSIIATSQRPAQIDKDFLGSADVIHCGRLAHQADAKVAAGVLDVDYRAILRLPDLHYFERRAGDVASAAGVLKFSARKTPSRAPLGSRHEAQILTPPASVAESSAASKPAAANAAFNPLEWWK